MAMGFEIVTTSEAEEGPVHLRPSYLAALVREKEGIETRIAQAKAVGADAGVIKALEADLAECKNQLGVAGGDASPVKRTAK